jgi:hypothetical protein
MKPVNQTKFSTFYSNGKRCTYGNCFVACLASILELPIEEVPNLYVFYDLESNVEDNPLWLIVLNMWLEAKFNRRLEKRLIGPTYDEGPVIARGISMRGKPHTIVLYERNSHGLVRHDPHPTNEGLKEIQYFWFLIPVTHGAG